MVLVEIQRGVSPNAGTVETQKPRKARNNKIVSWKNECLLLVARQQSAQQLIRAVTVATQ
jgi:hypothetical protein